MEVSGASAAVFRVGFGLVGVLLVARFFAMGWIDQLYIDPPFHFTYPGFAWVRPWPGPGMHLHFMVMGLAATGIALGYRYRLSALLFSLTLAYAELVDRTLYLNHYYWMTLTGAVIAFLPLHASWSLDARLGRIPRRSTIPLRAVWVLRFQVGMVYVFAGLAKLNLDWLFRAEPLATWLPARSHLWLIGPLLTVPAVAFAFSWAGALFDLTVVGWLSMKRTRLIAYLVLVLFHTMTWLLFPSIGVFPLLMSLGALVFFEPDWPTRWLGPMPGSPRESANRLSVARAGVVAIYVTVLIAVPLRHYLIPGDVKWTGEGYLASWQVMLSEKSGSVEFVVTDSSTGATWRVPPPDYLTERQVEIMSTDPVMIQQAAELISAELGGIPVAADARLSFNGRLSRPFTNPAVPIAGTEPRPRSWVLAEPGR
jgi:hypothetical protein